MLQFAKNSFPFVLLQRFMCKVFLKKETVYSSLSSGFFLDACLEVIGGWFLRYLEFLERFVEFFGHFVEFLAILLEFFIFLYLFSPKPLILLTFPWKKDEFFIPKGEKSSGRLSFLLKYFKNPPVHWVFLKNWAWVFLKLEFFRLEFFSKCPKKSLI